MQISPPTGELACRVDLYAFSGPNDPDQFAFGQHLAAANAGTLRDMLASFAFFCGHGSSASNQGLIQEFLPVLLVPLFSVAFAAAADDVHIPVGVILHLAVFAFLLAFFFRLEAIVEVVIQEGDLAVCQSLFEGDFFFLLIFFILSGFLGRYFLSDCFGLSNRFFNLFSLFFNFGSSFEFSRFSCFFGRGLPTPSLATSAARMVFS